MNEQVAEFEGESVCGGQCISVCIQEAHVCPLFVEGGGGLQVSSSITFYLFFEAGPLTELRACHFS